MDRSLHTRSLFELEKENTPVSQYTFDKTVGRLMDMTWGKFYELWSGFRFKDLDTGILERLIKKGVLPEDEPVRAWLHLVDAMPMLQTAARYLVPDQHAECADMSEPLRKVCDMIARSIREDYTKPTAPDQGLSTAICTAGSNMDSRLSKIEECLHALCDRCDSLEDQIIGLSALRRTTL